MNKRIQKQNYIYNLLVVAPRIFEASYRTTTVGIAPYCLNAATAHWIKTILFCYKMSKIAPFLSLLTLFRVSRDSKIQKPSVDNFINDFWTLTFQSFFNSGSFKIKVALILFLLELAFFAEFCRQFHQNTRFVKKIESTDMNLYLI